MLYHGSSLRIEGPLLPQEFRGFERPVLFATHDTARASLFMFPPDWLVSFGYEEETPFLCAWGTHEAFLDHDTEGYLYHLPDDGFTPGPKDYEWTIETPVLPSTVQTFPSSLRAILSFGVHVYFVSDDSLFSDLQAMDENRLQFLRSLEPEGHYELLRAY